MNFALSSVASELTYGLAVLFCHDCCKKKKMKPNGQLRSSRDKKEIANIFSAAVAQKNITFSDCIFVALQNSLFFICSAPFKNFELGL